MYNEERIRIVNALLSYVDHEKLMGWMKRPKSEWGYMTPSSLIKIGKTDQIWRFIGELRNGYPF
jgi:hypothetical protein